MAQSRKTTKDDDHEEDTDRTSTDRDQDNDSSDSEESSTRRVSLAAVAEHARKRLASLTGRDPETVTSIEATDSGWVVMVEVVESRRIPDSTDILALYETELDEAGRMTGYRRVRRYPRGRGGDE